MADTFEQQREADVIPEPEGAYLRRPSHSTTSGGDEFEATELVDAPPTSEEPRRVSRIISPQTTTVQWYTPIKVFWYHHVRISVPHDDCRDHLANERTYLAYLRTSLALAFLGVVISQLYRLQHAPNPDPVFGFFVLSKPVACIFHIAALCVAVMGSIRFFRQQSAMALGKVIAGGWELMGCGGFCFVFLLAMFALHIAVDVRKEQEP